MQSWTSSHCNCSNRIWNRSSLYLPIIAAMSIALNSQSVTMFKYSDGVCTVFITAFMSFASSPPVVKSFSISIWKQVCLTVLLIIFFGRLDPTTFKTLFLSILLIVKACVVLCRPLAILCSGPRKLETCPRTLGPRNYLRSLYFPGLSCIQEFSFLNPISSLHPKIQLMQY